jgi:hypothetical protein
MPHNSSQWVNHQFTGGWATDFGKTFYGSPEGGNLALPWLNRAENIQYTLDGKIKKAPGSNYYNSVASNSTLRSLNGNTNIRGIDEYTRTGTSGSPSTQLIIACGEDYFQFSSSTNTRIGTRDIQPGAEFEFPHFSTFNDLLILADSGTEGTGGSIPYSWDQTTFQPLTGGPPDFAFSTPHRGRHWAAGDPAAPSRLYYSVVGDPEDWIGAGSGSIDIDPGDGDSIVGLWSWKEQLWVFKGDKKLSIHRISGSTSSDFSRTNFITGISAAGQRSIFSYGDDIYFWNPHGSLHSLKATDTYGDYTQAYLNYPILSWCRDNMDFYSSQSAVFPITGYGLTNFRSGSYPEDSRYGATHNNLSMLIDFRFIAHEQYPRFALWPYLKCQSVAYAKKRDNRPALILGDGDGQVFELDGSEGVDDAGATYGHRGLDITATTQTPLLTYGNPIETKTLVHVGINLAPDEHHTSTINVAWNDETGFAQSTSVTRSFGVPLGTFVLGTDSLGTYGSRLASIEPMHGDFRSIQYTLSETSDKKIIIQSFSSLFTPSGESLEA